MGLGWKGTLHKTFALLCAALYVWQIIWGDLQWNFGTQRVSTGDVFWPKPFFLEPRESPDAATMIPLAQKLQGTPGPFNTAFSKAQHSLPSCPLSFWLGHGLPYFLGQEFSITVQYAPGSQEALENWLTTPGALVDLENHLSPLS